MVKENKKAFKSEGELFRSALREEWFKLHPEIRKRFDKKLSRGNAVKYCGVMDEIYCSFWGKILGYLSKIFIKGALIPYTAFNVPVDVEVYSQENCRYIIKNRIYNLPGREPQLFNSRTQECDKGEVLEYVGFGIGMKMLIFEKNSNLHFKSNGYFWDVGLFRIPIPNILSPGVIYLMHINEGENKFRIRIDINHKIFGKMFVQEGVFYEKRSP